MKPYLVKTTFDCISTGTKFRYGAMGETYLKTESVEISKDCLINCAKLKTGFLYGVSQKTEIYIKG